ncbi:uncharacterized protein FIBRA_03978 [Fibroporia radiculosa]|uniref:Yeast cell wall synthesis Kre9/Knh1-like N-terminal domain-containing protein n=1 Tax=Fibroporia radiculosa TaxID=599839 RepID=J4HWA2_9APHY|nr:uncharacterized protein FIBRA_03978 [Fibroporia radiculosa]CCM01907.1 predicted protein [Fibroporia radiculosa]
MSINKFTSTILFVLFSLVAFVSALPVHIARDVWDPPIISPNATTVWIVGQKYNVTWNTTNPPSQITNTVGRVVLAANGLEDYENPLAANFSILLGSIEVTCPNVTAGNDYAIVLFGDSGNFSPNFTITN